MLGSKMLIEQPHYLYSVSYSHWFVCSVLSCSCEEDLEVQQVRSTLERQNNSALIRPANDAGSMRASSFAQAGRKEKECIVAFLELEGITKYFGQLTAVDHISLAVEQGEFLTLLGPSGCGKTTILRMVAGFETPSEGNILLDDEDITNRAASKRPMGMVFQSYALFPHMTAEQNIAFGMS